MNDINWVIENIREQNVRLAEMAMEENGEQGDKLWELREIARKSLVTLEEKAKELELVD